MTRKEEIEQASFEYHSKLYLDGIKDDFVNGAEWADRTMIDKACEWLKENLPYSSKPPYQLIEDLRKAMEK